MRLAGAMTGVALGSFAFPPLAVPFHVPLVHSRSTSTLHRRAFAPQSSIRPKSRRCGAATSTAASHDEAAACIDAVVGQNKKLDELSRSELQGLCKRLNIRAVGKTSELISKLTKTRNGDEGVFVEAAPSTDHSLHKEAQHHHTASAVPPPLDVLPESGGFPLLSSVDGVSDGDAGQLVEATGHVEVEKVCNHYSTTTCLYDHVRNACTENDS